MAALTKVLLVNDGHFGPVQEGHQVLVGTIDVLLGRVEIYRELLERLVLDARLNVRNVECFANRLDVSAEQGITRTENRLYSVLQLSAG